MVVAAPTYTRTWQHLRHGPVPLAFIFDGTAVQPEHPVTVVSWTDPARSKLEELNARLLGQASPRRSLPIASLRGRLEVSDEHNLRLDRGLALRGRLGTILWTGQPVDQARASTNDAVLAWLNNEVSALDLDQAEQGLLRTLKQLARSDGVVSAGRRLAHVFDWERTRSGTATLNRDTNPQGWADLVDYVVRLLAGHEVLDGLGMLRRVAGRRLDRNEAELLTEPIDTGSALFSLVVRVRVLSFPGRATPVVTLELSRRAWTRGFKTWPRAREISAYALPDGEARALRFTLERERTDTGHVFVPAGDYHPIAVAHKLPQQPMGAAIAASGAAQPGCKLLVTMKHGVGDRVDTKQGVPDVDKVDIFNGIARVLGPHGLSMWEGLVEVASDTRAVKDRDQHWGAADDDAKAQARLDEWQRRAREAIAACYAGTHHLVIGYHSSCDQDAQEAARILKAILGASVRLQVIRLPAGVHGPRQALPPQPAHATMRPAERAAERAKAWAPFIEEIRRYQRDQGAIINGILVVAPKWYGHEGRAMPDDPVNKRAARITLARELGVPTQYLRPKAEAGQHPPRDPSKQFKTRLMVAWLDLAWKSLGRIKGDQFSERVGRIYGEASSPADEAGVLPPDRVLAVGILRRNETWLRNERSFVPFAIELDVATGLSTARFAREDGQSLMVTPPMPLPAALVELARCGPIRLATDRQNRIDQLQERSQRFFHQAITDACQRAKFPLVLIDAVACRGVWQWPTDEKMDANNVLLDGQAHAEADWGNARIVRIRPSYGPKVLWDGNYEAVCEDSGDTFTYHAPVWAQAELFKLTDTRAHVYLSFGSTIRKGQPRGVSCFRTIEGLKMEGPGAKRGTRTTLGMFTGAWSTPNGVEFTVVRPAPGEGPDQVARLVEWLRASYQHYPEWTTKPAPLFFESALKNYLADYDLPEAEEDEADGDDDEDEDDA